MDTEDIIKRLRELQIEQSTLLSLLAHHTTKDNSERKALKIGDRIKLLTSGAHCRIGDLATITKVKGIISS